jgi:hypothetical protein
MLNILRLFVKVALVSAACIGMLWGGNALLDRQTSDRIAKQLDRVLAQSMEYSAMEAAFFANTIRFNDVLVYDNRATIATPNLRAKKLILHVDYSNALLKNFQVTKIAAHNVALNFEYSATGQSNIHAIQHNLRKYLQVRREQNKSPVKWDVYEVVLTDLTVTLDDYQLGAIGTFELPQLILPRVSSSYSRQGNRDLVFQAIIKELGRQFMADSIRGDYDSLKLAKFISREGKSQMGEIFEVSKEKLGHKAKQYMYQFLKDVKG